MQPITRPWGLEHILQADGQAIITKLEIKNGLHADRKYHNIKDGTLEVVKGGGVIIQAYGTRQTWETFKHLNPGEVYQIYNDSKYQIVSIGDTEVIETKIPDLTNLLQKIKEEKYD